MLHRLKAKVREINGTLERIEDGAYDICTNCGGVIMPERLGALPYAALCNECQRKVAKHEFGNK